MQVDLSKKKIWGINDLITFGKYKGSKVKDVMKDEPSYLIWCQDNVEFFELDEDLLLQCEEAVERRKNKSRETNLNDFDDDDDGDSNNFRDDEIPF